MTTSRQDPRPGAGRRRPGTESALARVRRAGTRSRRHLAEILMRARELSAGAVASLWRHAGGPDPDDTVVIAPARRVSPADREPSAQAEPSSAFEREPPPPATGARWLLSALGRSGLRATSRRPLELALAAVTGAALVVVTSGPAALGGRTFTRRFALRASPPSLDAEASLTAMAGLARLASSVAPARAPAAREPARGETFLRARLLLAFVGHRIRVDRIDRRIESVDETTLSLGLAAGPGSAIRVPIAQLDPDALAEALPVAADRAFVAECLLDRGETAAGRALAERAGGSGRAMLRARAGR
jgi:hypothetical protein